MEIPGRGSSSPVVSGDRLVIVWLPAGGQSFIVSLDALSGRELWRVNRDEIDTWATPLVVEHDGRRPVIAPGMKRIKSYDLSASDPDKFRRGYAVLKSSEADGHSNAPR